MNLIMGFVIYSMVLMVWGETVLPNKYSVNVDSRLEQYVSVRRPNRNTTALQLRLL